MTDTKWLGERERGSMTMMRLTAATARLIGRRGMRLLVYVAACWYRLFDRSAVRASKLWLRQVYGREPSFVEVYHHLRSFAQVTVDRMYFMMGHLDAFKIERNGAELLQAQVATGRGAILLGAHLGSYDAMRAVGFSEDVPIKILGYFENAKRINRLMDELNPDQSTRVVHIGNDPMSATIQAKAAVDAGELVAIHGDRAELDSKPVSVPFMGKDALFPSGPFVLASLLRCPVYLTFGLYHDPNRYELHCIPFAESLHLPRKSRQEGLERVVRDYASILGKFAQRCPNNWFNFFDFWGQR